MNEDTKDLGPVAENEEVVSIREGIDRTRDQMNKTIEALEHKLNSSELRDRAATELEHVGGYVKAAVHEELMSVKVILDEEIEQTKRAVGDVLSQARVAVKEDATAMRAAVKEDIIAAAQAVKNDVRAAVVSAKQSARDSTLGRLEDLATGVGDTMNDTKDTLLDTVRQNPIPAALVGVGLAWLLMNRSTSARRRYASRPDMPFSRARRDGADGYGMDASYSPSYGGREGGEQTMMGEAADSARQAVSGAKRRIGEMAHDAGEALHDAKEKTVSSVGEAAEATSQFAHDAVAATSRMIGDASGSAGRSLSRAGDTVAGYARQIPVQARKVEQSAERFYADKPLAVGAAVLAAGALVGIALPRSEREDVLMGEARDQLLSSAKSMAHEAVGAVQHLGDDAAESVKGVLAQSAGV